MGAGVFPVFQITNGGGGNTFCVKMPYTKEESNNIEMGGRGARVFLIKNRGMGKRYFFVRINFLAPATKLGTNSVLIFAQFRANTGYIGKYAKIGENLSARKFERMRKDKKIGN